MATETAGTWHHQEIELVEEIGKRTNNIITGISVSAAVRGTSKGIRGFVSKYLRCQLVRCSLLCSLVLNVCVLV